MNVRAVIMAGGSGKRLRPLTCTMPKPMVPVLNKPVIDYCLELLKKCGAEDITAALHYLPDVIKRRCGDGGRYGVRLGYSVEEAPLGTAGSVRRALGSDLRRTIVMSGDAITDADLAAAVSAHEEKGAAATIVLKRVEAATEYGVALTREDGRIYRFLEKPTLSQVFSDLANTGIYILEPEVIERIPRGEPFDFSKDLFPLLLKEGLPIYGCTTDRYWCDIGDIAQYRAAQRDLLDGRCAFSSAAVQKDGIWREEGAMVSDEAELTAPCYIGRGAEIGAAVIGRYTVIGGESRVGRGSSVKRSVLMRGVRVREDAELRGAILCDGSEAESGTGMYEGTVLGSGSRLGRGGTLCRGALVWPERQVREGEVCRDNVKWGASSGPGPGCRVSGYTDTELTPERAVRVGAAFAACMGRLPAEAAVASDGSQQGAMLRHAVIAGLISQGVDAADMGFCACSAFEYGIREFGCGGGVYIRCGVGSHRAEMMLCGRTGAELDGSGFRAFSQELRFGEKQPVTWRRLGIVQRLNGAAKAYDAHLARLIRSNRCAGGGLSVIMGGGLDIYDAVARALLPLGYRVRHYSGRDISKAASGGRELGFAAEQGGVTNAVIFGEPVRPDRLTAALALAAVREGRANELTLPADMSVEYIKRIAGEGARVSIASVRRSDRMRAALEGGTYLPELFEPEASVIMAAELALAGKLEECLGLLPPVSIREKAVDCSWREVGRLLRGLVDEEKNGDVELVDGVKVKVDKGWVLVRPNDAVTACRVVAGSMDAEYSQELTDIYSEKLRSIQEEEK